VTRTALLPLLVTLVACKDETVKTDPTDTGAIEDTADTADTVDTSTGCEVAFSGVNVTNGATGVYYRDTFVVSFDGDAEAVGATVTIADGNGAAADTAITWAEGGVQASVTGVLRPETTYAMTVSVCGVDATTSFTTSSLGNELTLAPADLVGDTYVFRLSDSVITQPRFLDAVADSFLTVPILITVAAADESSIELLGALGELLNNGSYRQYSGEPTWSFPAADFTESPYFEAAADRIVLPYAGIDIPVEDFTLSGTFTADGSSLSEAIVTGLGDSRNMGALLGQEGNPNAMCDVAAAAGVSCEPCGDGEPYCLYIVAEQIDATQVPGVTVTPVP
jgi:hypothetical protein